MAKHRPADRHTSGFFPAVLLGRLSGVFFAGDVEKNVVRVIRGVIAALTQEVFLRFPIGERVFSQIGFGQRFWNVWTARLHKEAPYASEKNRRQRVGVVV